MKRVKFVSVAAVAIQDRRHVQYQDSRKPKIVPVVYWVDSDGDRWMTDEEGNDVRFDPVDKPTSSTIRTRRRIMTKRRGS